MPPVSMIDPVSGKVHLVPESEVSRALSDGWAIEDDGQATQRIAAEAEAEAFSDPLSQAETAIRGGARGLTLGLSDVLSSDKRRAAKLREHNPGLSVAGEIVGGVGGALAGIGPAGAAAGLGSRIATGGIARAAAGAAVEGAIVGAGSGISELALSEDPLSVERAISVLSSKALYGGAIGGAAGTLGKAAEKGLARAKGAIDDAVTQNAKRAQIGDDLADLDMKGVLAAEKAELSAIDAARVTQKKALAEEIISFRKDVKAGKQFLTTKDVDLPEMRELGAIARKVNRQLDAALDNPIGLMRNPAKALDALERQDNLLSRTLEKADDLKKVFATDTSGTRMAALQSVEQSLARNRELRAQLADIAAPATSSRMREIADAKEVLRSSGTQKAGIVEQAVKGTAFSAVTSAIAGTGIPGAGVIAPLIGGQVSSMIGEKVFGRFAKAMTEGVTRHEAAIGKLFEVGKRGTKLIAPTATRTLSSIKFSSSDDVAETPRKREALAAVYKQRSREIAESVEPGADGRPKMRLSARKRVADTLSPVAAAQPLLADKMETLAARRVEFLAEKMPKKPDLPGIQFGPDNWHPSDAEMRKWARYAMAVENPDGVIERAADGVVSVEEAEAMRAVYPEIVSDLIIRITEQAATANKPLPFNRAYSLSLLTGVPMSPAFDPKILSVLQKQYAVDVRAPKAVPQFGSVKSLDKGTLSERRERGAI